MCGRSTTRPAPAAGRTTPDAADVIADRADFGSRFSEPYRGKLARPPPTPPAEVPTDDPNRLPRASSRPGVPAQPKPEERAHLTPALNSNTPLLGVRVEPAPPTAETSAAPKDLVGETLLGQFHITRKFGEGGFGAVYLAEQVGIDRLAVIKVLHHKLASDTTFIKRFEREAKALAKLDHHHLVKLYNFGELQDGALFLAMEYGGDRTLAEEIRSAGRLYPERALRIAEQICDALDEAHRRGIVHRDLKPANVLLGERDGEDWVKVVDVGIAKILDNPGTDERLSKLTGEGMVIGTPAYFSPEQARGIDVEPRSDLYSLGCLLYEMLSGQLPVNARTPIDFVRAHIMEPPIPLKQRGVEVPAAVEKAVMKALSKEPDQRYSSAKEMAAELQNVRLQLKPGDRAPVVKASGRSAGQPAKRPSGSTPATPKRAVGLWVGVGLAALVVVGGGGFLVNELLDDGPPKKAKPKKDPVEPAPAPAPGDKYQQQVDAIVSRAREGKAQEALDELERLFAADPPPPSRLKGPIYRALGEVADKEGDSVQALKYLQLARTYLPKSEGAAVRAAIARLRSEQGLAPEKEQ